MSEDPVYNYRIGPAHITFYLGWKCNARCIMCWQDVARRKQREKGESPPELSFDHFNAILQRYPSTASIELCSFGEPMLNPDFGKMLDLLLSHKERWQNVNIITNGSRLDRFMGIGALPGSLTVSIDSPDPTTYAEIRRGLRLGPVARNVRSFIDQRTNDQRFVGINMVLLRKNLDQIEQMAQMAVDIGVDYLALLRGATLEYTDAAGEGVPEGDPAVKAAIQKIAERFPKLRVIDYFNPEHTGRDKAKQGHCLHPWINLDVGPDGKTHPCCRAHRLDFGDALTGNPWDNWTLVELREQIQSGKVDAERFPDCAKCPMLLG